MIFFNLEISLSISINIIADIIYPDDLFSVIMVIYIIYSNAVENIKTIYFQVQHQPASRTTEHYFLCHPTIQN